MRMMAGRIDWTAVPGLALWAGCHDLDELYPLLELVRDRVNGAPPEEDDEVM